MVATSKAQGTGGAAVAISKAKGAGEAAVEYTYVLEVCGPHAACGSGGDGGGGGADFGSSGVVDRDSVSVVLLLILVSALQCCGTHAAYGGGSGGDGCFLFRKRACVVTEQLIEARCNVDLQMKDRTTRNLLHSVLGEESSG